MKEKSEKIHNLTKLRKIADAAVDRVNKPLMTYDEYIDIQADVLGGLRSKRARKEFILSVMGVTKKSVAGEIKKKMYSHISPQTMQMALGVIKETEIIPWA